MNKLLITGSRNWNDVEIILEALEDAHDLLEKFIVISGACPTGLDYLFTIESRKQGILVEEYPADWERNCTDKCYHKPRMKNGKNYCPVAGNYRNSKMVDLNPNACFAFLLPGSRGTIDCAIKSVKKNIPTYIYDENGLSGVLDTSSTRDNIVIIEEGLF